MNWMKTIRNWKKIVKMHKIKKYIYSFCMSKMLKISVKTCAKNCIQNIIDKKNAMAMLCWKYL